MQHDVSIAEVLIFLEYCPNATVMDVMAEFDVGDVTAVELLRAVKRFLSLPSEMQTMLLKFWESLSVE